MANPIPPSNAILPLRRPVAFQHGDGVNVATITGTLTLTIASAQVQKINGGVSDRDVVLPPPLIPDNIGHPYRLYNAGSTNNLALKTSAGTTLATLLPGQWADVEHGPSNYVVTAVGGAGAGGSDFGAPGLLADVVEESTSGNDVVIRHWRYGASSELTIASGAIAATGGYHTIDTESDAASDDLNDITGGAAGDVLLVRAENSARTVVLKHAVGANKIATLGARDISLAEATDWALLVYNGTQWTVLASSVLAGTSDDVEFYDPTATTKKARLDCGEVTAGQTRVITVPDQNVGSDQWIRKATGTISAAALRTLNATPVEMIAAPAAGKYLKVLWVHWFLDYGGVAMDAAAAGDTLVARYTDASGAAVVDAVAGDAIGAASADYHTTVLAVPEVIPVAAAAIVAHINTGEWYAAAGTSELKFVAYYQECTLPT